MCSSDLFPSHDTQSQDIHMQSLVCYKTLPVWKHDSIPSAFQQAHNTKQGTWAKLHILKGELDFAMLTEQGEIISNHHFSVTEQPPFG